MRYTLLWVWLVSCLTFLSCQDDIISTETGYQAASFKVTQPSLDGIATRATDQRFEPGDEIGIYAVLRKDRNTPEALNPAGNYADNRRYTVDQEGNLQPYSEKEKILLSKGETYDFYAYYPYDAELISPESYTFHINPDQTDLDNYKAQDLMLARNLGESGSGDITLVFERKLALLEIHFEKVTGRNVTLATINNVNTNLYLNFSSNESVTPTSPSNSVKMNLYQETDNSYIFRALLPAQQLKRDNNYLLFVINGEYVQYKATTSTTLTAGEKSIYTLNMQYHIRAFSHDSYSGYVTGIEKEVFNHGESIHVKAFAKPNYYFIGWYESPMVGWQEYLTMVSDQPDLYITATKSVWYIARFDPICQPITAKAVTLGGYDSGGTVYGSGNGIQGQLYSVVAVTANGFEFTGWYVDNVRVSNSPAYEFTVPDHPVTLEARFQRKAVTITINCSPSKETLAPYYTNPSKVVRPYGDQVELHGSLVTNSPYIFTGWYEDGEYLNRDFAYTFTAEKDRTLLAKYCRRAFSLGACGGYEEINTPGRFTRSFMDPRAIHPTYLRAGQKLQQVCSLYYQDLIPEHSLPINITRKELVIKLGDRIILQTNDFEDHVFTAPEDGTYTFYYTIAMEGILLEGERTAGSLNINRIAWFLDD